jgi:hypothetical protein
MPLVKIDLTDKAAQLEAITKLPRLSLLVLEAVLKGQYAEPGFSDVSAEDLKIDGASKSVIAGAIGYLAEIQVLVVERANINGKNQRFLHATAHAFEYKDEALAAIKARKAALRKPVKKAAKATKATKATKRAPKKAAK